MEEEAVAVDPAAQDPQDDNQIDIYNYSYSCVLCSSPISKEKASLLTLANLVGEVKANILISTLCKSLHLPNQPWVEILRLGTTSENCNNPLPFSYCVKCIESMKEMERLWAKLDKLKYQVEELLAKSFAAQNDGRILDNLSKKVDDEKCCEQNNVISYFWNLYHVRKSLLQELKVNVGWKLICESYDHQEEALIIPNYNTCTKSKNTVQSQNPPLQISTEYDENAVHHPHIATDLESIKYELEEEINFIESSVPDLMSNDQEDEVNLEVANYVLPNPEETEDDPVWNPPSDMASESDDEDFTLSQEGSKSPRSKLQRKTRAVGSLTFNMRSRLMEEIYSGSKLLQIKLKPMQWEPLEKRWIFNDPPRPNYNHFTSNHKGKCEYKFKCNICDLQFPSRYQFERHRNRSLHKIKKQKLIQEMSNSGSSNQNVETDEELDEAQLPPIRRRHRRQNVLSECTKILFCTYDDCSFRFDTECRRDAHLLKAHDYESNPFKRKVSGKGYKTPQRLEVHESLHTGESPFSSRKGNDEAKFAKFKCNICDRHFPARYKFELHRNGTVHKGKKQKLIQEMSNSSSAKQKVETDEELDEAQLPPIRRRKRRQIALSKCTEIFLCTHNGCSFRFDTDVRRDAHVLKVHNNDSNPFKCKICGKGFKTPLRLEVHERHHTGELPFVCESCGKAFRAEVYLKKHLKQHEWNEIRNIILNTTTASENTTESTNTSTTCPVCKKSILRDSLKRHIIMHDEEKRFLCEICSSSFLRKADLNNHQRKAHPEIYLLPFKKEHTCKICSKLFHNKFYLKRHEMLHTGQNVPFQCSLCPYKCFGKNRIEVHERRHKNERLFKCSYHGCMASFYTNSSLVIHNRIHTGERPFQCTLCEMSFKTKEMRKKHTDVIHKKLTHYKCELCGEGFPMNKYLRRHLERHQSGKIPIPDKMNDTTSTTTIVTDK